MKKFISITLFLTLSTSLILCTNGEELQHQINLEDIERDNILSERRAQQLKGSPHISQSAQHFHPAGIQFSLAHNSQVNSDNGQQQQEVAEYTTGPQGEGDHHHAHQPLNHQNGQVQYVTPATNIQGHYYNPHSYVQQQTHNTYYGRQPFKPIIAKQQTPLAHQQHPQSQLQQPQFVYLQQTRGGIEKSGHSTTQHVPATGGLQYEEPQDNDAYDVVQQDEEKASQQNKVPREEPTAYQQQQQHQGHVAVTGEYPQYVPLVTRGSSPGESYIMMAPLPSGYFQGNNKAVAITPSVVTYSHSSTPTIFPVIPGSHSSAVQYSTVPAHGGIQYSTIPTRGGIQYLSNDDNHEANENNPPKSYSQDIQYANTEDIDSNPNVVTADKSKQFYYAPRHPERHGGAAPQTQDITQLHNLDTHKVIPLQEPRYVSVLQQPVHPVPVPQAHPLQSVQTIHPGVYASPQTVAQTFDFFSSRKAKSLLDSYIPSWVVIQKQRSLAQNNYVQEYVPSGSTYNTIAYSSPNESEQQGQRLMYYSGVHFKRSPKAQKTIGTKP